MIATSGVLSDAAHEAASHGWPVLPLNGIRDGACACGEGGCQSPGKHPHRDLAPHGLKDATTNVDIINTWWARFPDCNVGLRTGVAFDVLDVDGSEGLDSLAEAETAGNTTPMGPTTATGRGYHLLFRPTRLGNRAKFLPGLDWRGSGGYIVAPPSMHVSGSLYRWLPSGPDVPLQEVPPWLRGALERHPVPEPIGGVLIGKGHSPAYLRVALERELEAVLRAPEGTRNAQLNRSCHAVFRFAELKTASVTGAFETAALRVGLSPLEVRRTIRSAWEARS